MIASAAGYKVGVVAADPLRALGLEAILGDIAGVDPLVIAFADLASAPRLDALLLDARCCGEGDTAELVRDLRRERPGLKTILVSEALSSDRVQAVIGAGAKGYLPETASEGEIRMAVEVVLDGSVWAPRKVLARLLEAGSTRMPATVRAGGIADMLTPREKQVLNLLMDGRSNRSIAEAMKIDEVTVKAHLGRMLRKAGVSNRVELTLRAMEERGATRA